MISPVRVTLAYLHHAEVATSFHSSILALLEHDAATGRHLIHDDRRLTARCRTADELPEARNRIVRLFLRGDADWLLWVDTDMGWEGDVLERLLAAADPTERPIVGGLCFASREHTPDLMGGYRTRPQPTIYDRVDLGDGHPRYVPRSAYPPDTLLPCAGTGSACILIHRSVLERVGAGWYDRISGPGYPIGEDLSFCARAADAGYPIHVHTGIRTSHHKPRWVGETDFWEQYQAPPARDRTAVVVPAGANPDESAPFMRSLRASTGLTSVYAVCDQHGPQQPARDAWRGAGADQVITVGGPAGRYARSVNAGYRASTEPWILLADPTLVFGPGWLDQAQHMGYACDAAVVGVGDPGNPQVRGGHTAPLLIRRDYIEQVGATWDGPRVVCHDGYRHGSGAAEIVAVAKRRGQWVSAPGSRVEHPPPGAYATLAARLLVQQDTELFETRAARHMPM